MTPEDIRLSANAPGCFASPSAYSMDSKTCQACRAGKQCEVASIATLDAIRGTIDIKDVLARHFKARLKAWRARGDVTTPAEPETPPAAQPAPLPDHVDRLTPSERVVFDVTDEHEEILSKLATKTAELARQQIKQNVLDTVRSTLVAGKNPYEKTGPKFLRIACALLLEGGFSRASLNRAMVNQFGWRDTTAGPHVAQVCAMFNAFGITQEIDGHLLLTPDPDRFNEKTEQSKGTL